jgi:hypothetical protein
VLKAWSPLGRAQRWGPVGGKGGIGGGLLKGILGPQPLSLSLCLSHLPLLWGKQYSSTMLPPLSPCSPASLQVQNKKSSDHRLKPWAKINLSSCWPQVFCHSNRKLTQECFCCCSETETGYVVRLTSNACAQVILLVSASQVAGTVAQGIRPSWIVFFGSLPCMLCMEPLPFLLV